MPLKLNSARSASRTTKPTSLTIVIFLQTHQSVFANTFRARFQPRVVDDLDLVFRLFPKLY